jgi:putative endonuclease
LPREKKYYVYIMASKSRALYVGVTGSLVARVLQHKAGETDSFTKRYKITRLVYYEAFQYVNNAIARETEIKKWRREKKVALILASNRTWGGLGRRLGPVHLHGKNRFLPAVGMTRLWGVCN